MAKNLVVILVIAIVSFVCCHSEAGSIFEAKPKYRQIMVADYVSKMKAGWVGQMVGVGWGARTEFKFRGRIAPAWSMPEWTPEMVNQFRQDDIYVEMTFIRSLERYGLDVSQRQAGIDFANSKYGLWYANGAGRANLRRGIAPPDCSHPRYNPHPDSIDYQIDADYSGLISPGQPNMVIALGEKFGRLINYGDGLYGGQFVGGMYAAAFFESDPEKIVRAGLKCIPKGSQYYEAISDTLKWYKKNPDNWQKTWQLIEDKYNKNPKYLRTSSGALYRIRPNFNIDAKLNGTYILMGLLYGQGDLDQTIIISTRCGQDSDCNPSNAAGILFTSKGFDKLPAKFTSAIDPKAKFSHTLYDFPTLISVCEKLARQTVTESGGRIEKDSAGKEVFVIPVTKPKPSKLEQSWEPGPLAHSYFLPKEKGQITEKENKK